MGRRCSSTACGRGRCCSAISGSGSNRRDCPPICVRSSSGCVTAIPASAARSPSSAPRIAKESWCCRCFRNTRRARRRSAFDAVAAHLSHVRRLPALRFVETFHADDGYIKALAQNVNDYWVKHGRPGKLVLSFHGVPRRTLELGDPYHCFCQATGRLLARELGSRTRPVDAGVPVALRQGNVAAAVHGGCAAGAGQGRRATRRCVLPGIRRGLPGDARGNRHRGARAVQRGRRQRIPCRFPASTSIRAGSRRWPISRFAISPAGWRNRWIPTYAD